MVIVIDIFAINHHGQLQGASNFSTYSEGF